MANYAQGHGSPEAAARSKGTKGGGANDAGLGARLRAGRAGGGHRDNAHNTTLACNPGICYREPSHPNRPPLSLRCLLRPTGIALAAAFPLTATHTQPQLDVALLPLAVAAG
jgi:hypothetical protein